MGFWDAILGRREPRQPRLDSLFAVPSAAITLQTAMGFEPTGTGAVCFRAASGSAFADTQAVIVELLRNDPSALTVEETTDGFGFTWLVVHREPTEVAGLCTDLHAVNVMLAEQGFAPALLCSLVPFADSSGRRLGLVYLYKQGTFYPFAPTGGEQRDNLLEINAGEQLGGELPMEADRSRWMALWGAPGL